MSKQVIWTRVRVDTFKREAYLNGEEIAVLERHASGMSALEAVNSMPQEYTMTRDRYNRIIERLKAKYDAIQPHCSNVLPPRSSGAKETYRRAR